MTHGSPPSRLAQVQSQSLQSHLSSTNSLQRIRASCSQPASLGQSATDVETGKEKVQLFPPAPLSLHGDLHDPPKVSANTIYGARALDLLKWIFYAYACWCVSYLSFALLLRLGSGFPTLYKSPGYFHVTIRDPLAPSQNALTLGYRFSRLSTVYWESVALYPNVVKSDSAPGHAAACVWTHNMDLHIIHSFSAAWSGPVSILLMTRELPSSPRVGALISNLSGSNAKGLPTAFFLHILVVDGKAEATPNAYLNLARLYAPTQSVVLFPDDISTLPNFTSPTSAALLSDFSSPSVLVSADDHTSFPFEPLAPVALDRDLPLWCDERFISGSRELDWTECLWQVWLETFGDVPVYNAVQWSEALQATRTVSGSPSPAPPGAVTRKIHSKLSARFRLESCILASKQLASTGNPELNSRKARWLKENCPEGLNILS